MKENWQVFLIFIVPELIALSVMFFLLCRFAYKIRKQRKELEVRRVTFKLLHGYDPEEWDGGSTSRKYATPSKGKLILK